MFQVDLEVVENAAKELYIRALKSLPPDIKTGFTKLSGTERNTTAQSILSTMIKNISVAEQTDNLLCRIQEYRSITSGLGAMFRSMVSC